MMTWGALDADGNIVRDPTFPDIPTFKEVCEATEGLRNLGRGLGRVEGLLCRRLPGAETGLPARGHPARRDRHLYRRLRAVVARADFAEIASARVGKYPVFTGGGAQTALGTATSVPDEAKTYVTNWLQEAYGVSLN